MLRLVRTLIASNLCLRVVLPEMHRRRAGKIVDISDGGSTGSRPFFSSYLAPNEAVIRMTECVADELLESTVRVSAKALGVANTAISRFVIKAGASSGNMARREAQHVLPDGGVDLSALMVPAVNAASPASALITGRVTSDMSDDWRPWAGHCSATRKLMSSDGEKRRRMKPDLSEMYLKGRASVTGGAGFIGSHTVNLLLARGHVVRGPEIQGSAEYRREALRVVREANVVRPGRTA